MHKFINEKLVKQTKWFDDTLKNLKLSTFSSTRKKVKVAINGKEIQSSAQSALQSAKCKVQSDIFGKIALIQQTRKIEMQKVFCFTLGHVPWSLATDIGEFVKASFKPLR